MHAVRFRSAHSLMQAVRAIMVVDMVESVRLIEMDQRGVVDRWLGFVDRVESTILPGKKGRLVKHLGDGFMLEFEGVREAAAAAFAIQQESRVVNEGVSPDKQIRLRVGIEQGEVLIGGDDIYGHGVNLATRLSQLAGPDEIVVSASIRDHLTSAVDADIEDLGECFLKHVRTPVRAYRIRPAGLLPVPSFVLDDLRPTIAIIPFCERGGPTGQNFIGEILAEELIKRLSSSPYFDVISRLSTTAFRGRNFSLGDIRTHLGASHALSGVYSADRDRIQVYAELAETRTQKVVWAERLEEGVAAILSEDQELVSTITSRVTAAMTLYELNRSKTLPLFSLQGYTILLAAIALLHRNSLSDFTCAREMLDALVERYPRHSVPRAWIAKWHVFRTYQGWSEDPQKDAQHALAYAERALDADPESSLSLAISGMVRTHMSKEHAVAEECYDRAVQINPSDSLAWILRGVLQAFKGNGIEAVSSTQRALKLSPLDPLRYYYDCLAATAFAANHQYENAIDLAQRSARANKFHASTFRTLAFAQWFAGRHDEARATVRWLLQLEPNLTVGQYLERSPAALYETGKAWANALREAGLPN